MKKALVLMLVLVSATAIFGSYARQISLGNSSNYFQDATNVLRVPGLAPKYGNLVDLELGQFAATGFTPTGQWAMVNLSLTDAIYFGGALRRCEGRAFDMAADYGLTSPNPGFDVWAAYDLGGLGVGLGVYAAGYSRGTTYEESIQEENYKASVMTVKAGVAAEIGETEIEGVAIFSMNKVSQDDTNADTTTYTFESTGGTEIGVGLRGFIPWGYDAVLVPRLGFSTFSSGWEENDNTTITQSDGDFSTMILSVGAALNYTVMEDGIISVGLGVDLNTETDELDTSATSEDKRMVMPEVTIGAEIPAFDWMVLRTGVTKQFVKHTVNTNGDEVVTSDNEGNDLFVSFGAGLTLGDFELDMSISEDFLFYGPNVVSGVANNIAGRASLSYFWGN